MTFQSSVLALSPTGYWRMQETSGTTFADLGSSPANATLAGTGGIFANSPVSIPSDPTSRTFNTQGTAYGKLPKRITTLTGSWTYMFVVNGEDAGWPDFRILSEGSSSDTGHTLGMTTVGSGKYDTQNARVVIRATVSGAPVDFIGPDQCVGVLFDNRPHLGFLTYSYSAGNYSVDLTIDGTVTDTWSGALPGGSSYAAPNEATVGALGRDTYSAMLETGYGEIAQWSGTALTLAQRQSLTTAWKGSYAPSPRTWQSGAYRDGTNPAGMASYGTARGRPVDVINFFPYDNANASTLTWSQIEQAPRAVNNGYQISAYQGTNSSKIILSVPMLPYDSTQTLSNGANASTSINYDSHWTNWATNWVAAGFPNMQIRLGWEPDVAFFTHSYNNTRVTTTGGPGAAQAKADYRQYFRRIVAAIRAVSGANFTFIFNPQLVAYQWELAYPGDDVVDVLGVDNYDYRPTTNSPVQTPGDPVTTGWNLICTGNGNNGLNFLTRFRRIGATRLAGGGAGTPTVSTTAKPIAFPEWAYYNPEVQGGHGGGDNSVYAQRMGSYMQSHQVVMECYFEHNNSGTAGSPGVAGGAGPFSALFQSGSNQYPFTLGKAAYMAAIALPVAVPGAVTALTPTLTGLTLGLTWTAPAGSTVTSYLVTAAPLSSSPALTSQTVTGTSASFTLTAGSSYTFTVTASNSTGSGPGTTSSTVTVPGGGTGGTGGGTGTTISATPTINALPTAPLPTVYYPLTLTDGADDGDSLANAAIQRLASLIGNGWRPYLPNPEVAAVQVAAFIAADLRALVRTAGEAMFAAFGQQILQNPQGFDAPSQITTSWTANNSNGLVIPAGTQVSYPGSGATPLTFTTHGDMVIPSGTSVVTGIVLLSDQTGAYTNSVPLGASLEIQGSLMALSSVVVTTAATGGRDAESDAAYRVRLIGLTRSLGQTLVLPMDYALAAQQADPAVYRAFAVPNFDANNPGTVNPLRTVSVFLLSASGLPVQSDVAATVKAALQSRREAGFNVVVTDGSGNAIMPAYVRVTIAATVVARPGYDTGAVQAACVSVLANYLSPAYWAGGLDTPARWTGDVLIRPHDISSILSSVPGVDHVDRLAIGGGAIAIAGTDNYTLAPSAYTSAVLPAGTYAALTFWPTPSSITVTVNPPVV